MNALLKLECEYIKLRCELGQYIYDMKIVIVFFSIYEYTIYKNCLIDHSDIYTTSDLFKMPTKSFNDYLHIYK